MGEFDDIRPYQDDEVSEVLKGLLANDDFVGLIGKFRAPLMSRLLPRLVMARVRQLLAKEIIGIDSVAAFQQAVSHYVDRLVTNSITTYEYVGIDALAKDQGYLFVSNHRDIAADSMLLDYALFYSGYDTVRIAIGDNLLQKKFATDLMRLNKSFIIMRSAEGAKKVYAALLQSSRYIHQSILDNHSIWIAQSEGRAKNGVDQTDPALVKMLLLSQRKFDGSFAELIRSMKIVPVAIAYEFDPCDQMKAMELSMVEEAGHYEKPAGEDLLSLVKGISEFKGRVKLVVGSPLTGDFASVDEVAVELDRQILSNYTLFPSNFVALSLLQESSYVQVMDKHRDAFGNKYDLSDTQTFMARLESCPEAYRHKMIEMYANPVVNIDRLVPERFT